MLAFSHRNISTLCKEQYVISSKEFTFRNHLSCEVYLLAVPRTVINLIVHLLVIPLTPERIINLIDHLLAIILTLITA